MLPPIPAWEGLHPLVIHFPIALLVAAPLFLVAGLLPWRHARSFAVSALAMVALGTAGTWVAVATGHAAGEMVVRTPEVSAALERHEEIAETVRTLFTGLTAILAALLVLPSLLRRELGRKLQLSVHAIFLVLYLAGTMTLVNAAHQGGRLVHQLGVTGWASGAGAGSSASGATATSLPAVHDADRD